MKTIVQLDEGWKLKGFEPFEALSAADGRLAGADGWLDTAVPAQVHEVLLREGIIEDPAEWGKTQACQWVAEQDWIYRRTFAFDGPAGPGVRAYLHFKGLDTLADVYVNGELVARHNDMFVPLRTEVTGRLRAVNELVLHFRSAHAYIRQLELPSEWEGKIRRSRLLRKHEHDFAPYLSAKPYFTRVGVYDSVQLELVDETEIAETDLRIGLTEGYRQGKVQTTVFGSGYAEGSVLKLEVRGPDGRLAAEYAGRIDPGSGGSWQHRCELTVDAPELWWPRGYGGQPLYEVTVTVLAGGEVKDRETKRVGFRDVVMEKPLDFVINGRRVKLWGAQSAPLTGITHRWDNEKSNRLLDLLENGNMNAQRIWGGSDRYDDRFYEETDRRGILVWQEFFHDYGMYPDTDEYRDLCRKEAEYQVKRLKHHPSLLFWCGGNECFMGAEFELPGVPYIGGEIFLEDYKRICETLDPDRYYHINSPWGGAYCNDPLEGDTHSYTNTWYVPGADYPVLIAEEIRTSPPAEKSFLRYMGGRERAWPEGYSGLITKKDKYPWPDTWTEKTTTFGWRKIPPIEQFYDSDDLESAVYKFGAAHGLYLRKIIENNRRGKPSASPEGERICKGHFVCRWNDSWPVIYGSMIDYYGEPYIPYYAVKRAYEPVLLSFDVGDFIYLWIVNDGIRDVKGTVHIKLFDPEANRFAAETARQVYAAPGESELICDLNEFKQFSRQYVLYAYLTGENGERLARTNDFVDIEKHLHFPEAKLTLETDGEALIVTTDKFARCIELGGVSEDGDEFGWLFEDNYFDLLPGETKRVNILGRHAKGTITAKPYYSPYASTVEYGV
ncbi:glycoside hydrolase family 2 protein [Paenibacillus humicola]|uniref:glycoside hydrolase family 2 protein n=1 Tax=Paenibacillus humicola TaxID=3110540 RepID=UPI00237A61C6|nr:glycoside hydrolase family 2 protein [Paenibacillus humicola]